MDTEVVWEVCIEVGRIGENPYGIEFLHSLYSTNHSIHPFPCTPSPERSTVCV